ncbi:MAG: hypothetical protein QY325_05415 [Flavobacteriales bacterium]|jgi:hypothetical protein|nr:MAG: hypothetical protein QY325_05415 [Flavobacteriales bacterium]
MHRSFRILCLAATFIMGTVKAQEYRIEYRWLNEACAEVLNCEGGCTACNLAAGTSGPLIGTNAAWIGVDACPLPIAVGDNAVFSTGWTAEPAGDRVLAISGVATAPIRIDSIRFRHALYADGPQRVKVLFTPDAAMAPEVVADVEVPLEFTSVALSDLGSVVPPEGSSIGTFQLRFQPYQNTNGAWALDEVVVVASPLQGTQTGIAEVWERIPQGKGPLHDLMGRPVGDEPAPGVYIRGNKRQVQVF